MDSGLRGCVGENVNEDGFLVGSDFYAAGLSAFNGYI